MKKLTRSIVSSHQIEEDIHVPFHIVGRTEWLKKEIDPVVLKKYQSTKVTGTNSLKNIHEWLSSKPILGVDSETGGDNKRDGLDPISISSRMILFQIGTKDRVYLIEPDLVNEFKSELENPSILKLGQNIIHDFKFVLAKYGVHLVNHAYDRHTDRLIPSVYDTMLAEQIITAGLFGTGVGLGALSRRYDPHVLISKEVRKEFINLSGMLEYRHLYYAAKDVFLLFDIYEGQKKLASKYTDMWNRIQLEFCCISATADAELTGFDVSEPIIKTVIEYYQKKADKITDRVGALYKGAKVNKEKRVYIIEGEEEGFDLDSNSQKLKALNAMGFNISDVKRETLKELNTEITDLLAEYTECTKVISTYGQNILDKRSLSDGRVHPEFNQLGSGDIEARKGGGKSTTIDTGRYSSDAQQFPRPQHILDPIEGDQLKEIERLFAKEIQEGRNKIKETMNAS